MAKNTALKAAAEDTTLLERLQTQWAVEQFLYHQAEILDERRWWDFLMLFTKDGHYWMPAKPSDTTGEGVPSIFYEDHYMMRTRAKRLDHPRAWSQHPANRCSHVVSNVIIESEDADTGDVVCRSRFHMVEFRMDEQRHFAGRYRHHLKHTPEGYRIQLQRVDILNYDGPFEYVLQFWV